MESCENLVADRRYTENGRAGVYVADHSSRLRENGRAEGRRSQLRLSLAVKILYMFEGNDSNLNIRPTISSDHLDPPTLISEDTYPRNLP